MSGEALFTEGLHHGDDGPGLLLCHRAELAETLAVFGEAHGDHGAADKAHVVHVLHGSLELGTVVPAGADHDLPVHGDAGSPEGAHGLQAPGGVPVSQKGAAELGVRGVDGDVDGADPQFHDPRDLPVGEVGEGDIIAHQEAQTGVVVLKIQGGAQVGGHLVHEAEQAVVGAGHGIVHQVAVKVEAKLLPLALLHPEGAAHAALALQYQLRIGVIAEEAVVQHVGNIVAVDCNQFFPAPDARPAGGRVRVERGNDGAHRRSFF